MKMFTQKGTTTVEFAIVGSAMMLVLLLSIEMSRMIFVINTLGEVTRRGGRMAAVCPIDDPEIARVAIFNSTGGATSPIIHDLDTSNILLSYLNESGEAVTGTLTDPATFVQIHYVRVEIQNFTHRMILPIPVSFTMPAQAATYPRESLGIPRRGVIQPCSVG
jgi:Flp pilus assembly protein TadG